jgi:hypothetical protein
VLAAGGLTALLGSAATLVGAQGIMAAGSAAGAGAGASGAMAAGAGAVSMAAMGEALAALGPPLLAAIAFFQLMTEHAESFGAFFSVIGGSAAGAILHTISGVFMTLVAIFKSIVGVLTAALYPIFMSLFQLFILEYAAVMSFVEILRVLYETISDVIQIMSGGDLAKGADDMEQFTKNVKHGMADIVAFVLNLFSSALLWLARATDGIPFLQEDSNNLYNAAAIMKSKIPEAMKRILGDEYVSKRDGEEELGYTGIMDVGEFGGSGPITLDENNIEVKKERKYAPATEINVQRMIINQEFKGNSDPDRVVASFMKKVTDQATRPLTSGVL